MGVIDFIGDLVMAVLTGVGNALVAFTGVCMGFFGRVYGLINGFFWSHGIPVNWFLIKIILVVVGFFVAVSYIRWRLGYGRDSEKDKKAREKADKGDEKDLFSLSERIEMLPIPGAEAIASFVGLYKVILYVMFYPCAFITGLFWAISGHGSNMAFFTGMLSGDMAHTFSNYLQWYEAPKYICAIVIVKLTMKAVGCIGRRDFKGFLRTAFLTLSVAMLGSLVGLFYINMQIASRGNFILTVLSLIPSLVVYLTYPYTALALIMPLILISMPVVLLIMQPFIMFSRAALEGVAKGELHQMQTEAFVKGDMLTHRALEQAGQGKLGLLLFLDVLNM